ncbi:NAD(P)-binding protein [Hyaloscypha variabilis F]|uniref:NAD(P)-binding protein n=1 Tax=Hyaloscypha variabilis (strain UAMH 11265 / GT02V1 / F) TaxID=1149755 RepID=A0A2J6SDZ8_HYAVF|nr:NAD(P)-binding protein [Hyaloscypha variabilis F]
MAATMRISSQVWPIWLPRAVARAEHRILNTTPSSKFSNQSIPPVLFSATFRSLLSPTQPAESTTSRPAFSPSSKRSQLRPRQQIRAFSTSPTSPPPIQPVPEGSNVPDWTPPTDASSRPVTIIGAGVLGRRLATLWSSTGRPVNLYDTSISALESSTTYIADALSSHCSTAGTHPGHVHFATSLHDPLIANSWMVIEAVPEDLDLKISILGRLDRLLPKSTIIATNSASFRSGELVSEVKNRERVLNTLYYIPPKNKCVELMSCGYTSPYLIPFLAAELHEQGLHPMVVETESTGLIFPRIFAALKRETLKVLSEGVARPQDVDTLFKDFFGSEEGPCKMMDRVGLDTVAKTERHFLAEERGEEGEGMGLELEGRVPEYLGWLEREFVRKGKLGEKSGEGLLVGRIVGKDSEGKKVKEFPAQEVWQEHAVDLSGL